MRFRVTRRAASRKQLPPTAGVTLTELMVTVVVLAVGGLGMVGAFAYMARAVQAHRTATLATNLSQEQIEVLKNKNYFEVIPTAAPAYDNRFSPPVAYDTALYPPATAKVGNISFQRLTYVERVLASGNSFVTVPPDSLDTGIKRITVTIVWKSGGTWRRQSISNLLASSQYSNTGGFSGTVTDAVTHLPVPGADVYAKGNLLFHDFTGLDGTYVMSATPGSFTLAAQAPGYFKSSPATVYSVTNGNVTSADFQLTPMATGGISGAVYVNPSLLISQVVASTVQSHANFDVQYIELYNPTTSTIFIGNGSSHAVRVNFTSALGFTCADIPMTYNTTGVAPNHYYLIANTSTFSVSGVSYAADAVYNANGDGSLNPTVCVGSGNGQCVGTGPFRAPCAGYSGTVYLTDSSGGAIDAVGWTGGGFTPSGCSGTCYPLAGGLQRGDQLVRMTSTGTVVASLGNAYNSHENNLNFVLDSPLALPPRASASSNAPISGTPAYGAVITSNDGLSASTAAWMASSNGFHYASFTLVNVATGSWIVDISSGSAALEISSVGVVGNAYTAIPSSATSPAWPAAGLNNAILTGVNSNGIVSGRVTDPNGSPMAGITVSVQGEYSGLTDASGRYFVAAAPNTYTVTANPGNLSPNYSSQQLADVVVAGGQISGGNDLVISGAGRVSGYVCDFSLANPYPGVTVTALDGNGNSVAQVVTASNGKFTIPNLSTGIYSIAVVLDPDQSATATPLTPCSSASDAISCAVTAGSNVSVGTFTVAGAYGTISGRVTASGAPITTGVMIVATTGTVSGSLPPAVSTATLAGTPFYMASSQSDGTYSLSVRASTASATFNLYGWYTTFAGSTPVVVKKNATVNVTGGQSSTANLAW